MNISEILTQREEVPGVILDPSDPMKSARALVNMSFSSYGVRTLHRFRNVFWLWNGSCYDLVDDEAIGAKVWTFLDAAICMRDDRTPAQKRNGAPCVLRAAPFKPTKRTVADVVAALGAETQLNPKIEPPVWLTKTDMPAAKELFACGNGLLCLASGELYQPSPDFFNLYASEVLYDLNAPEPNEWLKFLDEIFENDKEAIALQQEWFGYCLSSDTFQQKMLLEFGPPRCGKGTKARILRIVLGRESVAGPTISSLQQQFGLEPLIAKSVAIISDARVGRHTDKSSIVERLLSISGEDAMTVDRKFKSAWHGRLPTRIIILTNEIPALTEGSGALAGRLMILVMTKSFLGREDPTLTDKLSAEVSGILNWAIRGYRSLKKRGYFVQPESSKRLENQIELLAAPVKAFIAECCEVGSGCTVKVDDLWSAYINWCFPQRKDPGDKAWFGRNLSAAVPGVERGRPREDGDRVPTYTGLRLLPAVAATLAAQAKTAERRAPF